jgi:general secretion pathway protein C
VARSARTLAAAVAAFALAATAAAHAGNPRSQVRVLGTVVSSDATRSLAMVEAGGASRAVRVGQDLDGATVVEIRSESVVLRRRGELETLALASVSRPASVRGGDVPASPAPSDAELAATDPEHARRAPPRNAQRRAPRPAAPAPAPVAEPTGAGAAARSNDEMLAEISKQARFAAVNDDNGKLRGVALMFNESVLERLGLRSDDVVTSINGVAIDSSGAALREARGIDPKRPVALGIERRGVPLKLQVDLRNLQR